MLILGKMLIHGIIVFITIYYSQLSATTFPLAWLGSMLTREVNWRNSRKRSNIPLQLLGIGLHQPRYPDIVYRKDD